MGRILSINVSHKRGVVKAPVDEAVLVPGRGIEGDAHAAPGDRQVSLLMEESIEKMRARIRAQLAAEPERKRHRKLELEPGAFAENLTVEGIDLAALAIGDEVLVGEGEGLRLRVSKIGKECHHGCAILKLVGDCIMPREGIFCEVLTGGTIRPGDPIAPR